MKIKESFTGLLFEGLYFTTIYDGCRYQSLSRCSNRMFSLNTEVKMLHNLGQYVRNSIVVSRLLVEISSYALPTLVLLENFNSPEDYRVPIKKYPFLKDGKSK